MWPVASVKKGFQALEKNGGGWGGGRQRDRRGGRERESGRGREGTLSPKDTSCRHSCEDTQVRGSVLIRGNHEGPAGLACGEWLLPLCRGSGRHHMVMLVDPCTRL